MSLWLSGRSWPPLDSPAGECAPGVANVDVSISFVKFMCPQRSVLRREHPSISEVGNQFGGSCALGNLCALLKYGRALIHSEL